MLKSLTSLLLLSIGLNVYGSHIRAGEITARRIDPIANTYEFTFTGFRDSGTILEFGSGIFEFGDGNSIERNFEIIKTSVGNNTEMVQFRLVHTYQSANSYIVSYQENYRNANIINIDNSDFNPFYVETMIVIDPFYGLNNSPYFTVPPIDYAAVGSVFLHNPGAFDIDGDSLSFRFLVPRQTADDEVSNYRVLNDTAFYEDFDIGNAALNGPPILTLDPLKGNLVWDAPGQLLNQGDRAAYNVAFLIEEWRFIKQTGKWEQIGYVMRDMQIIVTETNNERPEIFIPDDLCVVAGTIIDEEFRAQDIDGDPIKIEAYGGPFEVVPSASLEPSSGEYFYPPTTARFLWETACESVRERPYQVEVKVSDQPAVGPPLVDFKTWQITVVGPAPTGLETTIRQNRTIQLDWDSYSCPNAEFMQVWRRVGEYAIEIDDCETGMPPNTGYELVDRVEIDKTSYLDNDHGVGLAPGANYCYRLVAEFGGTTGGESYVGEAVCDQFEVYAPVITNVDVKSTDSLSGQMLVRWTPPYQLDKSVSPPPYNYDLLRAESGSVEFQKLSQSLIDTVFIDENIDTYDKVYQYFVMAYDGNGVFLDSSAIAASPRLTSVPTFASIRLSWSADVPWSNHTHQYPYHYIYRGLGVGNPLELIDSVNVTENGFSYIDKDEELIAGQDYCYFITTQGSYDNDLLPEPLLNSSQVACARLLDLIPPCKPENLILVGMNECESHMVSGSCNPVLFNQQLTWNGDIASDCDDDLAYYNVYFSPTGLEEDFSLLSSTTENYFEREFLTSIKGCYRISSVDRSGNESDFTDVVYRDNCPNYSLPNVFTPNGDGINDVFTPFNLQVSENSGLNTSECPRSVLSVLFTVYDRNGSEVFEYESFENEEGVFINWDGRNKLDQLVESSVYYYSAEVIFDVLDQKKAKEIIKGWVQVIR